MAAAAAPSRAGASALDAGTWFEAATPFGTLRLCAFAGHGMRHAAGAALALERCEALLEALHRWTGIALDWRWSPMAPRRPSGSHAAACWEPPPALDAEGAPRDLLCLLSLPWALLRTCAPPDPALAVHLRWSSVPGVLAVSRIALEPVDIGLLEPGGAIVLPESMQQPWIGRLRSADEPPLAGLGAPVSMASAVAPRLVAAAAAPAAPEAATHDDDGSERIACELRLSLSHTLPGDRFTGWHEGPVPADAGSRASLWRCPGEGVAALELAAGRLMPWGEGWALAIETVAPA